MGIPENIDALMAEYDIPASSIARAAGVTEASVSDWRRKGAIPRRKNLEKLCEYYAISLDDILSDENGLAAKAHGRTESSSKEVAVVPLYGSVAAGVEIEMLKVDDHKFVPAQFLRDDSDIYMVRVRGNSMSRVIQDGELALVSPKYTEPNEHDIFLVTVNGDDATIKRLHMLENGVELLPDSYDPTYRPRVLDFGNDDTPEFRILGKVVWWCADF